MAGLYIHYPFCKKACTYCNFHFSTQLKNAYSFTFLMAKELDMRASFLKNCPLESIYFGGGSPSLMDPGELGSFIQDANKRFSFDSEIEITVELNPDDVSLDYLQRLKKEAVNRVSLGIQSFRNKDLQLMNRVHNSDQARQALEACLSVFENVSVDLIYGMPYTNIEDWKENLSFLNQYPIPHIAAYALTVEPKTALAAQVVKGEVVLLDEEEVVAQYEYLVNKTESKGLVNYEFSNFGKQGFFSVNNSNYWKRKPYLGIGPGAHSYDGNTIRNWNISNNNLYRKAIEQGKLAFESEVLSKKDMFNETLMTGLRTQWGVNRVQIEKDFGEIYARHLEEQCTDHILQNNLFWDGDTLMVTKQARFLTDGIAADLFLVALES